MLDTLISAGSRLLGGIMSDRATRDANAENAAIRREEMARQDAAAARNEALQREFAQQGIRWKVEDAKAAGVHPAYALGAQTTSFSPISIGSTSMESSARTGVASAMSDMGQDVGRAIRATASPADRIYDATLKSLQLQRAGLENDLLRTQIASQVRRTSGPAVGPALPVPEAGKFEDRPQLMLGGKKWPTDPGTTNAEDFEKRYNELSDFIISPQIFYHDRKWAGSQAQKEAARQWSRQYQSNKQWYHSRRPVVSDAQRRRGYVPRGSYW